MPRKYEIYEYANKILELEAFKILGEGASKENVKLTLSLTLRVEKGCASSPLKLASEKSKA